jgi:hypothetical protein
VHSANWTEMGRPVPFPTGEVPRKPACAWCGHDVRLDLRPAFTSWGVLILECISADWCDARAFARDRACLAPGSEQ